jgi:hypothetical protein
MISSPQSELHHGLKRTDKINKSLDSERDPECKSHVLSVDEIHSLISSEKIEVRITNSDMRLQRQGACTFQLH